MTTPSTEAPSAPGRTLAWPGFLVVVIGYLVIIQGLGALTGISKGELKSEFPTAEYVLRGGLIPIGLSVAYGIAVVTWLGWWGEVWRSDRPVRRWVRWVPVSMLVAALVATNYARLAEQPAALILALVALGVFVGVGEELMFRGIGVTVFRRGGFTEGKVALWSSVIFGLVHVSNAIGQGPQALVQAVLVSTSGYFFYLCLRAGGVLLVPMLIHGLWDFSLISSLSGTEDPKPYLGLVLIIVVQFVLIVVTLRRRRIVDAESGDGAPAPAAVARST